MPDQHSTLPTEELKREKVAAAHPSPFVGSKVFLKQYPGPSKGQRDAKFRAAPCFCTGTYLQVKQDIRAGTKGDLIIQDFKL